MSPIDFSRLEKKAQKINKQSDELTGAITAINEKLNSLNLGVTVFCKDRFDYEDLPEEHWVERYLGYGKIGASKWGLLVRTEEMVPTAYDRDGSIDQFKTINILNDYLLSSSRQIRMKALDHIQQLVEALEAEADRLEDSVEQAKEIAKNL